MILPNLNGGIIILPDSFNESSEPIIADNSEEDSEESLVLNIFTAFLVIIAILLIIAVITLIKVIIMW